MKIDTTKDLIFDDKLIDENGYDPEKYNFWYIPVIDYSPAKKLKNTHAVYYPDLPINLKEVNIDLDYSKITTDFLRYKLNLILPNKVNSPYALLYGNKNSIDENGQIIKPQNKQKVFLDPSEFELNKKYDNDFLNNYVKNKYGNEWKVSSKPKVYKCIVPMDVPYWGQGSGIASEHYISVNNNVPLNFQKWIQYDKQANWKQVNEEFKNEFKAVVKDLNWNRGNAQIAFAWISTFLISPSFAISTTLAHYYHEVEISTIEFWIKKEETSIISDYPEITKQLFKNNFILDNSSWQDVSKSIGDIEPFKFTLKPFEKLIIKGLFLPKTIEINKVIFPIPYIKNLTQLHIKYIK
ncbi:hypothetical protein ACJA25_00490 [Mycoplasmopsis hyopharyngis]|uniref:hypothetical protein n=1 Tax=Mycoplasmopsis hyopharyngis TaxID=29558 RepID=UPI003872AE92